MNESEAEIYGWLVSAVTVALMVVPIVVAIWSSIDGWLRAAVCFLSVFYIFGIMAVQHAVVEWIWSKVEE